MNSKALNFFLKIRNSYWYIPSILSFFVLILSILTLRLDQLFVWHWLEYIGWFHASNPEGARVILSTIASSMISVVGVSFSMTIVAVAFAGSHMGPRLTANFMSDKVNQTTLGLFIATFLYCLFILLALFNGNKDGVTPLNEVFIPQISLLVAIVLSISSIILLIYFFHHIPESINMSNVIARIGKELTNQLECIFPNNLGIERLEPPPSFKDHYLQETLVLANQAGYLRIIDGKRLLKIANKHDLIIQLNVQHGDFITKELALLIIFSKKPIDKELQCQCQNVFALGSKRNQDQDPLFLIDELVEVIARALSPGINDPFTAITCMDWLHSSLKKLSHISLPSKYRYDTTNQLRLITPSTELAEIYGLIFERIQPYISQDRNASMHMLKVLAALYQCNQNQDHKAVIAHHAITLKKETENYLSPQDAKDILIHYKKYFDLPEQQSILQDI